MFQEANKEKKEKKKKKKTPQEWAFDFEEQSSYREMDLEITSKAKLTSVTRYLKETCIQ